MRIARRPHSTPTPVGPSILVRRERQEIALESATLTGMCGTTLSAVHQHERAWAWASFATSRTGLITPSTFDM